MDEAIIYTWLTFSGHAGTQTGLEATVAARVARARVNDTVLSALTDVRRVFRQTATKKLLHSDNKLQPD